MIRKLISVGLCSIGVLALLGAGVAQTEETSNQTVNNTKFISATLGSDFSKVVSTSASEGTNELFSVEDSQDLDNKDVDVFYDMGVLPDFSDLNELEKENLEEEIIPESVDSVELAVPEAPPVEPLILAGDEFLRVNGFPVNTDTKRFIEEGVTYVSLLAMAKVLEPSAACMWDSGKKVATIETEHMTVEGKAGQLYLVANGRYLYIEETLQQGEEDLIVPLTVVLEAFDASYSWDSASNVVSVVTGSGFIESGDTFYNADDLFWLSRVIYAESGHEPVEGQMGVAIVVFNRMAHPEYPDTVLGVLSQRNQFSTYKNGALADRTPNASSIIAAKLVMDGGVVKELARATHFDSLADSWADRNLATILVIGGHTFYA